MQRLFNNIITLDEMAREMISRVDLGDADAPGYKDTALAEEIQKGMKSLKVWVTHRST